MSCYLHCRRSSNCQPICTARAEKKEVTQDKENDAPVEETVTEPIEGPKAEASTSDSTPIDVKKISTEPNNKTVGAIRKT